MQLRFCHQRLKDILSTLCNKKATAHCEHSATLLDLTELTLWFYSDVSESRHWVTFCSLSTYWYFEIFLKPSKLDDITLKALMLSFSTIHGLLSSSIISSKWEKLFAGFAVIVPLVPPLLRANKACSAKSRLFSVLAPQWWNKLPTNVRTNTLHLPQRTQDSFVQTSSWPHIASLHPNHPPKKIVCTCMFVSLALLSQHLCTQMRTWQLFLYFFYSIDSDMLWFLSCDKCAYCKSLWSEASAKCPKCKCCRYCHFFCKKCYKLHMDSPSCLVFFFSFLHF